MLALTRPPEPKGFDESVCDARTAIEKIVQRGGKLEKEDFKARLWQRHKAAFADAQSGKCGYCDHDTHVGYHGDVEHYAPKSKIHRLREPNNKPDHAQKPGEQTKAHPFEMLHERGYYWRAYDWTNYLYACAICNTIHKRCLFPVVDDADETPGFPHPDIPVEPLLLNPYDEGFTPSEHLGFDELGFVFDDDSTRAWETIQTCRLDRRELQEARLPKASEVGQYLDIFERATLEGDVNGIRVALTKLGDLGDLATPFAGMARIMVERRTGRRWDTLMALKTALERQPGAGET